MGRRHKVGRINHEMTYKCGLAEIRLSNVFKVGLRYGTGVRAVEFERYQLFRVQLQP